MSIKATLAHMKVTSILDIDECRNKMLPKKTTKLPPGYVVWKEAGKTPSFYICMGAETPRRSRVFASTIRVALTRYKRAA